MRQIQLYLRYMESPTMTKEQIVARLEAVQKELDKYYTPCDTVEDNAKAMSARAFDSLIAERDRLTRALA